MTSKPAFPSIDHELASQPRPRLNLRALKPREAMDDAVVEANSRQLGKQWGASTTLASESDPEKEATRSAIASLNSRYRHIWITNLRWRPHRRG